MKKLISRRSFLQVTAALSAAGALAACGSNPSSGIAAPASSGAVVEAAGWPTAAKNVEVYLPAKAGGPTDVECRLLTDYLTKACKGTNFAVVNETGGNGVVAMDAVRESDPAKLDTVLYFHTGAINKYVTGMYDYLVTDPKDFTIINVPSTMVEGRALTVKADSPWKTLDEFVAAAKAAPGSIGIGIENANNSHFASVMFMDSAGIELKLVESGGQADTLNGLLGGYLDCALAAPMQIAQYVETGELRVLAVSNASKIFPDVENMEDRGWVANVPSYSFLVGPAGVTTEQVEAIRKAMAGLDSDTAMLDYMEKSGSISLEYTGEEEVALLSEIADQLIAAAEKYNIKVS